jgi:hypothetical protein
MYRNRERKNEIWVRQWTNFLEICPRLCSNFNMKEISRLFYDILIKTETDKNLQKNRNQVVVCGRVKRIPHRIFTNPLEQSSTE